MYIRSTIDKERLTGLALRNDTKEINTKEINTFTKKDKVDDMYQLVIYITYM